MTFLGKQDCYDITYWESKCIKSAIYNPLNLLAIKAKSNIYNCQCTYLDSTTNMEEERQNAGKYLTEILENNENNWEVLINQWKIVDKKVLFKFILWILR